MKVAIFGGTFDPVHLGHLITAEDILKDLKLDKIIFVPAGTPPHKAKQNLTPSSHRYNMLKLALKPFPGFELSDYEVKKAGKSYTIDTVRYYKKKLKKTDKLYFLAGADIVGQISTWKDWKKLVKEVKFLIMTRPGFKADRRTLKIGHLIEIRNVDISSSNIRKMLKKGLPVTYLIPEAVEEYIDKNRLYR